MKDKEYEIRKEIIDGVEHVTVIPLGKEIKKPKKASSNSNQNNE